MLWGNKEKALCPEPRFLALSPLWSPEGRGPRKSWEPREPAGALPSGGTGDLGIAPAETIAGRLGALLAPASKARDSGRADLHESSVAGPGQRGLVSLEFQGSVVFILGVWPEGSDGTDINAVCRAHERKLLSTGDDFGKVHLFSYPCSQFRVRLPHGPCPQGACVTACASGGACVTASALGAHASWPPLAVW